MTLYTKVLYQHPSIAPTFRGSRQRLVWDLEKQQLLEGGRQAQDLLSYSYRAPWTLNV